MTRRIGAARRASIAPLLAALAALGPGARAGEPARGFVGREGTRFVLGGATFRVAGTSVHYLPWGTDEEVDAALADARAMGFNVVRFFVAGIEGGGSRPTIWGWPKAPDSANMKMRGVRVAYWDEAAGAMAFDDGPRGLGRVDAVVAKAGALGLRLDVALLDFWQYSGGSQQMRAWRGSLDDLGATGLGAAPRGADPGARHRVFFEDARCKADYRRLVEHVLTRRNPRTGLAYRDDPTIFAWDLMNEPAMASRGLALSWKREMAAFVKSIDRNHLLSTGSEGFYDGSGGNDPAAELAIPEVDFGTWHTYPAYHGISPADVPRLIARHAADARAAGKPVLLQEFGYGSDRPDQAAVYRLWTSAIAASPDSAGWIHWRLASRMAGGAWPADNGEHLDVRRDGSPTSRALSDAARALRAPGGR